MKKNIWHIKLRYCETVIFILSIKLSMEWLQPANVYQLLATKLIIISAS